MSRVQKFLLVHGAALLVICLILGALYAYVAYNPAVYIYREGYAVPPEFAGQEYHRDWLNIYDRPLLDISAAESISNCEAEIIIWQQDVDAEIKENYIAPLNIRISGEVADGKTTLRYTGYATTKEGELVDYKNEKVFSFVLCENDELFLRPEERENR